MIAAEFAARLLGCTVEQAKAQYARNADGFREMIASAKRSKSGKCNGYTVAQLEDSARRYDAMAQGGEWRPKVRS